MNHHAHVLIVDDEPEVCRLLRDYLCEAGYRVSVAHDGAAMRQIIAQSAVDLVLLDVVLPREDGLTLARSLRASHPQIAIIMLTGRGDTIDRIIGLEMGADDYLAKPFHLRELLARIKSLRRRAAEPAVATPQTADRSRVRFAGWLFDLTARQLSTSAGDNIHLTSGEFDLLVAFVTHPNQVLSRDRLIDLAGNRTAAPFDRTIDVQVGRLRRKLSDDPKRPRLIKTLRGGGYMFTAPIEMTTAPAPVAAGREQASRDCDIAGAA